MIYNILRFFALLLLLAFALMKDIKVSSAIKNAEIQLYIAVGIVAIIIVIDNITGFILGLAILVLYFKIYNKELKEKKQQSPEKKEERCPLEKIDKQNTVIKEVLSKHNDVSELDYVSEQHLIAAQNNIVDVDNYKNEIIGFGELEKNIYNGKIYGSQGFDSNNAHIRGMDYSTTYLGSLTYSLLE